MAATGTDHTEGVLTDNALTVAVESDRLVAFGDGMEDDHLELSWGQRITVSTATRTLALVV